MMGWVSQVDWAVVVATFVGPIAAVAITLWYQERSAWKSSRRSLFVSMMRTRRNPTNAEFVGALNLVPVYFYSENAVMQRYKELMAIFDDTMWLQAEARARLGEKADLHVAYLLSEMSKAVGTPVEQLQILRGAYAPQGWLDEEQAQKRLRESLTAIATGNAVLPVAVIPPPQSLIQTEAAATPEDIK
ncbi:hypothetical protein FHT87_001862 [Rhizobium sp. BK316]|uniref:DUF6680 family protein n=1 Tax=Rhizobium sp. BK316 TaxID=2587053 RepID=UPI00161FF844|nr:DUF6680 family protein [Rhizobium sp. BK316]MBB3407959.1 hypothetical protein [Rhizobium sp. BK316]